MAATPPKAAARHPVGRRGPTPARRTARASDPKPLALPHERDESPTGVAAEPDPAMLQAQRDIAAGQVDTDMWATAGANAELRERLVPGAGGKPPGKRR